MAYECTTELLGSYKKEDLKKEAKRAGLKNFSILNKDELIKFMMKHKELFGHMKYQEGCNRRNSNKTDETKRVKKICWHINNNTTLGRKIKNAYHKASYIIINSYFFVSYIKPKSCIIFFLS